MAGKGGGAWKVAYADFVTAMMAFFLVMWIVAQSKPVKEAVANYFKDPTGSGVGLIKGKGDSLLPLNDGGPSPFDKNPKNMAKAKPNAQPSAQGADVVEERTSSKANRIALAGDESLNVGTQVLYPEDSAELDDSGRQALNQLIPALLGKFSKIELRGHASGRRLADDSPYKDAWELSYARSLSTMKYLVEQGIDARRIRLSQSGSNDPNLMTDGAAGKIKNSRVEIYVLNEMITPASDAEERRNIRNKKIGPKRPRGKPVEKEAKPENET